MTSTRHFITHTVDDRLHQGLLWTSKLGVEALRRDGAKPPADITDFVDRLATTLSDPQQSSTFAGSVVVEDSLVVGRERAAELLDISVAHLDRLDLPSLKIGALRKYRRNDLKEFVENACS